MYLHHEIFACRIGQSKETKCRTDKSKHETHKRTQQDTEEIGDETREIIRSHKRRKEFRHGYKLNTRLCRFGAYDDLW